MSYEWPLYACLFLALWSAVIGGVFSAFSEFIMKALIRTEPSAGIQAMQQINLTVIKTQFVAGILLIPLISIVFAVYGFSAFEKNVAFFLAFAAVVFVISVFLVTIFGNVPMNNKLDAFDPTSPEAANYWQTYGRVWTRLNHFRSLGSVVTSGIYLTAAMCLIDNGHM